MLTYNHARVSQAEKHHRINQVLLAISCSGHFWLDMDGITYCLCPSIIAILHVQENLCICSLAYKIVCTIPP